MGQQETATIEANPPSQPAEAAWGGNLRLRTVLCPVDLSDISRRALQFAARIASHFDARLQVQHTFPLIPGAPQLRPGESLPIEALPPDFQAREMELRKLVEETGADRCHFTLILNDGDPRERILETIAAKGIDLLVIGTRSQRGLRRLMQGSLTERVVHEATCPALVFSQREVHHMHRGRFDPLRMRTILVPVNFSRNSMRQIIYGLRWAWDPASHVILLHSVETAPPALGKLSDLLPEYGPHVEKHLREAEAKMRELVPFPDRLPCRIDFEVRDGDPKQQILHVAKEKKADLIVMGARMWGGPGSTWGSTIAGLLRDGRYPVLAIRHLGE
jgi:nucleotide-binding universal stress UspA family protein